MTLLALKALWRFRALALALALVLGAWAWVASERRAAYARGQHDQAVALLVRSVSRRIALADSLGRVARHDREVASVWHARTLTARAALDSALRAPAPDGTITVPAADVTTVVTSEAKCTLALASCATETAALRATIADLRSLPVLPPRAPQHPKLAALAGFLVGAAAMYGATR